jgi:hypothetical protein
MVAMIFGFEKRSIVNSTFLNLSAALTSDDPVLVGSGAREDRHIR